MSSRDGSLLTEGRLDALDRDAATALLAYLNLPPVGALADADGVPALGTDAAYELPAAVRGGLEERRAELGAFSSPGDLLGIDGFGSAELDAMVERLSNVRRYGNRIRPVWGGPAGERALFELLESAQRYVHIEMYIIGGEVGLRLADLIARKVRQGVHVRLLFTASGFVISGGPSGAGVVSRLSNLRSYAYNDMYARKKLVRRLREAGADVVDAAPIGRHWRRRSFRDQGVTDARGYESWARARQLPDEWIDEQERVDRECAVGFANVDHRKMVLVDGELALVGSQNIADSYFYSNELSDDPRVNRKRWQWHDNSSVLEGGAVADLNRLFARRWMLSGGDIFDPDDTLYSPPPRRAGNDTVALEPTIPGLLEVPLSKNVGRLLWSLLGADRRPLLVGNNPIRDRLLQMAEIATSDFYVEHCYPSDSDLLEQWSARAATLPGFTMVVPLHYDTKLLGLECDRFYPEMISAGARLWGYDRAIMHSKIAVTDGWYVSTGSYNLTVRSARADLELQFFVQSSEYGAAVRKHIEDDLEQSRPIEPTLVDRIRSRNSVPILDALVRYFFF